jgi:hypothetical protein
VLKLGVNLFFLGCFASICHFAAAASDIEVQIKIARCFYLQYEPISTVVSFTNLSNQDILLKDDNSTHWLSFYITDLQDQKIQPDPAFVPAPIVLKSHSTQSFKVNLCAAYFIRDTGPYVAQAIVSADGNIFTSKATRFEICKGRTIWKKRALYHGTKCTYSLLHFFDSKGIMLYARAESQVNNAVYFTQPLGPANVNEPLPEPQIDPNGRLIVFYHPPHQNYECSIFSPDKGTEETHSIGQ